MFVVYVMTPLVTQSSPLIVCVMVNNELERLWNEAVFCEEWRTKTWKNLRQGSQCPEQESNLAHPEYKSGALLVPPCSILKVNWVFKQDESSWFYIYDKISVYTSTWIQHICRIQTGKLKITRIEEDLWWARCTFATGRVSAWAIFLSTKLWCSYILIAWTCMATTFMCGVLIFYCTCDWNEVEGVLGRMFILYYIYISQIQCLSQDSWIWNKSQIYIRRHLQDL
jgi:hypothetical protein